MDRDQELRREFQRRQQSQRTVQTVALPAGAVAFMGTVTCGAGGLLLLGLAIAGVAGLLAWTVKNWRCPRCNRLLGKRLGITRCPWCEFEYF